MRKNVHPRIWGRSGWTFLRNSVRACDEESMPFYQTLMHTLPQILPCEKCRKHAAVFLQENPICKDTDMEEWINKFEETVAERKNEELDRRPAPKQYMPRLFHAIALCLLIGFFAFLYSISKGKIAQR